jgi:crotonobetainyl-CoA:carnitine CoA-transferase CaiB-like acyl-CoA transferase
LVSGHVGVNFEVAGQFNPPLYPVGNEDPGNGLVGAVGMLMGLLFRRRTGRGQYLEHPQLNATMTHLAHVVRTAGGTVIGAGRLDSLQLGVSALDRLYETADGWLCLSATEAHLPALHKVLGVDLAKDPRYATAQARTEHDQSLGADLADAFAERPTAELHADLRAGGVPVAVPVPKNDAAFLRDEANVAKGRVGVSVHPVRGLVRELTQLVRVGDAPVIRHRHAPLLGEHTDEVLNEVGVLRERVVGWRVRGVVR